MVVTGLWARRLLPGLLLGTVLCVVPTRVDTAQAATPVAVGSVAPARCAGVARSFRPTRVRLPGRVAAVRVLARGRDRTGRSKPPPMTATGKQQFAWDRSVRPGSAYGVVRLTAHTYPEWAGPALGNRLLRSLKVGDVLTVTGADGEQLCYRVSQRRRTPADASVPAYYSSGGRPRLAILVCSGTRRGPGDWSHRTIWFAEPIPSPGAGAGPGD